MANTVLKLNNFTVVYKTQKGPLEAVRNVSFELKEGETLAIVGESGCGKSSLARGILRLFPRNLEKATGEIYINGTEVLSLKEEEFRKNIRWSKISMVFQGAMNSLNPILKIVHQVAEPLIVHFGMEKFSAYQRAKEILSLVGIPESFAERYPFELSGGMKQRVVIAMALVTHPSIVILDEPTSALDVITQANIMNLLKVLKKDLNLSYIFITHDIATASELADRVAVMYAGEIVEISPAEKFYNSPAHGYTMMLLNSVPTLKTTKKLKAIPGSPPSLINPPSGCRFHPRCQYVMDICKEKEPPMFKKDEDHYAKCYIGESHE
ncbi:ABC transporter ATP-binding protein [Dictyoglomus thermophilum]|uniref:DppD-1 dipeptide transport system ATP-binding protein dppD or dppF or oligopeptide transport system ATP-binding protein oppD or oppF n=2 Tax=Dictyoglomus thermophilum TaxID=14 RepID=B5YE24_DICT6|nr:ABC transporter ATP-binding protein [Dictyoglomus thermophilum]ACI19195.1 DppD-1 dipeptide transport system ATP-binding protein dppD or dppF or oligopeptide transport system ATP-binding protein oppD or oppF [Dictyoglomus thermophilum H-6-12]MCX7720932.1 ABC transporter ATP-binding protein [Dictyoglomus thermophilum]TYT22398.1 ABC transporter ATP-binding protein [Dictyoglomus thermophilum]